MRVEWLLIYAPVWLLERMYKLIFRFHATKTSAFPQSADFMKTRLDDRDSSIDFKMFKQPIYGRKKKNFLLAQQRNDFILTK